MAEIVIAWNNLTVCACSNQKRILNNIRGGFVRNSLNALMGSSGCGKSSLLKTLNGSRKYTLSEESKIYVRDDCKNSFIFIYQDQEDRIMTGLTVEKALTYSSKLKNSSERGVDHKSIVSELMDEFMLTDVRENRIENCSGGQIKRISIALELTSVAKPDILFIDEPTTGLDSYGVKQVTIFIFKLFYLV